MSPGPTELIIILVIVLLLFGAKKLPDLAASMGKSIKEFRKASEEVEATPEEKRPDEKRAESTSEQES